MTRMKYVFIVLIIIIIALISQIAWMGHREDLRNHELELNASWDEGWDIGYPQGLNDAIETIILQAEQTGMARIYIDENNTYMLFNPEGCGNQYQAELQTSGCEVRCP